MLLQFLGVCVFLEPQGEKIEMRNGSLTGPNDITGKRIVRWNYETVRDWSVTVLVTESATELKTDWEIVTYH